MYFEYNFKLLSISVFQLNKTKRVASIYIKMPCLIL